MFHCVCVKEIKRGRKREGNGKHNYLFLFTYVLAALVTAIITKHL